MAESGETTVVGADSHFKGELTFERTAKIVGRFDGKIGGNGVLDVAQNAQCKADITAAGVNVDGTIEGNLTCKDTVKLNGSGTVRGDITAGKMTMAEGASIYGMVNVGPDAQKQPAQRGGGNVPPAQPSEQ